MLADVLLAGAIGVPVGLVILWCIARVQRARRRRQLIEQIRRDAQRSIEDPGYFIDGDWDHVPRGE